MRHLKKFEEMDYDQLRDQSHSDFHGSHNDMEARREDDEDCPDCGRRGEGCDCIDYDDELRDYVKPSNRDRDYEEEEDEERSWGDENHQLEKFSTFNEKKASPAQLAARKAFADRIKGKKSDKKDDKKTTTKKGEKPDFLDVDKDGDKKESMKKASKDSKEKEVEKGGKKGLTAGQKKLPEAMQKAILKKQK